MKELLSNKPAAIAISIVIIIIAMCFTNPTWENHKSAICNDSPIEPMPTIF